MSANDAVDGASSAASKCYSSCVGSARNKGGEATVNVEGGALKELARTRRRNADKVDPGIGRTRLGHRTLKCALTIGTRSAQSIMASGFTAAQTGRTHDRTGHFDRETSLIAVRLRLDWPHLNYVFRTITKFDQKA
jgi:hypothetical protein